MANKSLHFDFSSLKIVQEGTVLFKDTLNTFYLFFNLQLFQIYQNKNGLKRQYNIQILSFLALFFYDLV